jgi:ADP-heptose:LPS heptosyltransferase
MVTNDSGPLHLAVAVGLRTVSLFGPETPVLYGPRGAGHRVLFRNLPCSPCMNVHDVKRVRCIFDRPLCLHDLPEEAALAETVAALEGKPDPAPVQRVAATL